MASIVLITVGLFVSLKIMESPAFRQVQESHTETQMPIVNVVRYYQRNIPLVRGMRIAENGTFYMITVFVLDYATKQLGLSRGIAL